MGCEAVECFLKELRKQFARRKILLVEARSDSNKETLEVSGKQLRVCWFPKMEVLLQMGSEEANENIYDLFMERCAFYIREHVHYARASKIKK